MTIEEALKILQSIIKFNTFHRDYDHVVKLAELYRQLITGKDQEKLLIQFVRREEPELFLQRKALTQTITPAVAETIMNPFFRIGRLDNAKKIIDYPDQTESSERPIAEISERIAQFWGEEALDKYLATRFVQLSFMDPNSWFVVEFDSFDSRYQKARPYPIEFSSKQAIDFRIKNNKTEYLVIKKEITKTLADGTKKTGSQFIMYLENDILQYTEHLEEDLLNLNGTLTVSNFQQSDMFWQPNGSTRYLLQAFKPKGGEVQAVRIGYKGDLETDSRTFVNPFHPAMAFFMKTIKSVSEMDLTQSLHVFPQKLQYVDQCEGTISDPCNGGEVENGQKCKVCKGSGVKIHTTAQDAITLPLPDLKKLQGGNYMKLEDILVYKAPPVELLKFQDEYIEKLTSKAIKAVFNSGVIAEKSLVKTATEAIENKDELYNTLQPFAENYSSVYKKAVRLIASFIDFGKGLRVVHEFPSDFKLKTVTELLNDLKQASDSGAPAFVIQQINKDIAAKLYADDQTAYMKFVVKNRFMPFLGKSSDEIIYIISSGFARIEDRILWSHSDTIFDELELEVPNFFMFTYEKQVPLVDAKVKKILEGIPEDPAAIDFRSALPGTEEDPLATPNDVEAEAKAKLKGSVGGTQGILQIQASVAQGVTQYEAAVALLFEIYGFEDATARKLLGNPEELKAAKPTGAPVV